MRTAGKDATEVFYSLHRKEVLDKPMYKRLVIGTIANEQPTIQVDEPPESLSTVPYGEAMGLTPGYYTPYYTEKHREFHRAVRKFTMEVVYPEAMAREEDGKRITQSVVDKMACV